MTALLAILARVWPYLLGAALVIGGWLYLDRACWSSACVTKAHQLRELEAQIEQARERATALALLWSESINRVEVRYVERQQEASQVAGRLRDRHNRGEAAGTSGGIRLSVGAVGLLRDAAGAANDSAAPRVDQVPAEAVPQAARDTTADEWLAFVIDAAEAYRDAADKHLACVAAYEAISQSPHESPRGD